MNIQDITRSLFLHRTLRPTYTLIPDANVDVPINNSLIKPNDSYFEVRIHEMYLSIDRKFFVTRYPTLQSVVQFLAEGDQSTVFHLEGPQQLNNLSGDRRRIITRNSRIVGPIPYCGDEIELLIGLMAIKGDNFVESVLNTLSNISKIIGVGQFTLAVQIAETVRQSFDDLLSIKDSELCIGIYDRISPQVALPNTSSLQSSYRLVATIAQDKLSPEQLWVKDGRLFVGSNRKNATQPTDFDYFLFTIDFLQSRADWFSLTTISPAIKKLNQLLASSTSEEEIKMQFELLKGAVLSTSELVFSDKAKIIHGVKKRVRDILELKSNGLDEITFLGEVKGPHGDEILGPLGDLPSIVKNNMVETSITTHDLINERL